ncbi:MAG TPA: EVE domain-containing protein [Burkholderiaceae bacterium]
MPSYWLMKSEPDECSISDVEQAPGRKVPWIGVRNYQARNFMRDQMRVGDGVLFYHSSCPEPGVAGIAAVASAAYDDASQFDAASPYFDARSDPAKPRWQHVDVRHLATTPLLSLKEMRMRPELASMQLLKPGSRLSITPVTPAEWEAVIAALVELGAKPEIRQLVAKLASA